MDAWCRIQTGRLRYDPREAANIKQMMPSNPEEVARAADALINAYGGREALGKARLIEATSVVPEFAAAVRENLEARCEQKRSQRGD